MSKISKETFSYKTVDIDNVDFEYCHFDHCNFVYSGGVYRLNGCSFVNCEWEMRGPAQKTLMLLHHLYQTPGMQAYIENTFETIRKGV